MALSDILGGRFILVYHTAWYQSKNGWWIYIYCTYNYLRGHLTAVWAMSKTQLLVQR